MNAKFSYLESFRFIEEIELSELESRIINEKVPSTTKAGKAVGTLLSHSTTVGAEAINKLVALISSIAMFIIKSLNFILVIIIDLPLLIQKAIQRSIEILGEIGSSAYVATMAKIRGDIILYINVEDIHILEGLFNRYDETLKDIEIIASDKDFIRKKVLSRKNKLEDNLVRIIQSNQKMKSSLNFKKKAVPITEENVESYLSSKSNSYLSKLLKLVKMGESFSRRIEDNHLIKTIEENARQLQKLEVEGQDVKEGLDFARKAYMEIQKFFSFYSKLMSIVQKDVNTMMKSLDAISKGANKRVKKEIISESQEILFHLKKGDSSFNIQKMNEAPESIKALIKEKANRHNIRIDKFEKNRAHGRDRITNESKTIMFKFIEESEE